MKKILFVNSSLTGGGSERVMTLLANGFSKKNFCVDMILLREKKETYEVEERVNCIRIKYKYNNKFYKAIKRFFHLRKIIKNGNYDYVISFMYDINMLTLIASMGLKPKIIVSERNNPLARKHSKLYLFIEHKMYLKTVNIVFQTEEVLKMFPEDIQEKGIIIPNPVNDKLPTIKNNNKNSIIAAGRLVKQKNFEMLIRGFAKFKRNDTKDYKMYIYGNGEEKDKLLYLINNLGMKDYIFINDFIDELPRVMSESKIYVSTSNFEGISNSMLEAMAIGVPSICTDCPVGGARMAIKNNINGILIKVDDEGALSDALYELTTNHELYKKISINSRNVRNEYSINNIVNKWMKIVV